MSYRVSRLVKVYGVQRNTVLRPDPFLAEGITFLRHDPDERAINGLARLLFAARA